RLAVGLSKSTELLGFVVTSFVGPHELAVDGDLNGIANEAHAGEHAAVSFADAVAGPGEAEGSELGVDAAEHFISFGWSRGLDCFGPPIHPLVVLLKVTSSVGGNHDAVVGDVEQAVVDGDGDV